MSPTTSNSGNQPATNDPAMTATNTALSNQNTPTSNPSSSEGASLKSNTSLANQPTKEQATQIMTNATSSAQQQAHETAEKLNKILTQKQTSEAAKGQLREVSNQKEATKSSVQTDFAQKQNTSSKATQSAKNSQSSQETKSMLPDTGDVSSLGLGALGAVMMTTSFALKGSKHSRK